MNKSHMKRIRASAIIRYEGNVVLMYRKKFKEGKEVEYYTIPGGGVEAGETVLEAVKREILEEVGIEINITEEYFYLEDETSIQYFYISDYVSGKIGSGTGPEFSNRAGNIERYGIYRIEIIYKEQIKDINLMPPEIKGYILENVEKIFS